MKKIKKWLCKPLMAALTLMCTMMTAMMPMTAHAAETEAQENVVTVDEETFNTIARLNLNSYDKENQNFRIVELQGVSEKTGGTDAIWHETRSKCYHIDNPDTAKIVVEYQNIGTYNGKSIDCRLSFYGFVNQWGRTIEPLMNVGYYFQLGHWAFSLDAYITQYDYYYHGDDPSNVIEMRDAFMTTLDIDSGERVVYMNNDQVAGYVAPQSTVYSRDISYKGQTYRAFDSRSSYHNDATQTLQENSVAIPLTGTSQIFLNELTADEELQEVGYSSSYISPSTYSLGYDLPVIHLYDITTEVENGTITESETEIVCGEDRTISYAPEDGYILDSVTVDGEAVEVEQGNSEWAFENIQANHTIKVVYVPAEHPVKAVADQNGNNLVGQYVTNGEEAVYTVTVSNPTSLAKDMTVTDVIPDSLEIKSVSDDGVIDGQTITWNLQDVPAHETKSVTATVAAIGTDAEQIVDNTAQLTVDGVTMTSNNVRILIPVKPTVTTKETTVTNTTVNNEVENNKTINNKTVNNETTNKTVTIEKQSTVEQTPRTEDASKSSTQNTASQTTTTTPAATTTAGTTNSTVTTTTTTASTTTAETTTATPLPATTATNTGYRNVATGDLSRAGILLAIAGAAAVGLGIYYGCYYRKRR